MAEMSTQNLSAFAKKYAEDVLGETDEIRVKSAREIRKWLDENSFVKVYIEDRTIVAFLRGCKYNMEKAKKKLIDYYTMRTKIPEWYKNRDPSSAEIQQVLKLGLFVPLKQLFDNKLVLIIRIANDYDPCVHKINDIMKVGKMVMDVAGMMYENASVFGIVVIAVCRNVKIRYATQLTPSLIKNFAWGYQCDCWRPKQIECVEAPFYLDLALSIFKACVKTKIKNRIRGHKSLNSLYGAVDRKILPPEYGGEGDDLNYLTEFWRKKVTAHREWFLKDEKYEVNSKDV